ncbi:TPA: RHS domain-containing protein [Providencia stuartii]|nr:RHS domain-containing protein [Providencia stuartii]HEM7165928.1 RHS domain-containing protein [Providencia stuartii]
MLYVYEDADSYAPLARVDSVGEQHDIFYFQCQPNGLPDALYDAEGQLQWQARFTSWGKTEIELGNLHSNGYARSQNLRFQGQYFDRETGLHYNAFRYYDPDIGRFTQQDPIGLLSGLNLYQYAPNGLG